MASSQAGFATSAAVWELMWRFSFFLSPTSPSQLLSPPIDFFGAAPMAPIRPASCAHLPDLRPWLLPPAPTLARASCPLRSATPPGLGCPLLTGPCSPGPMASPPLAPTPAPPPPLRPAHELTPHTRLSCLRLGPLGSPRPGPRLRPPLRATRPAWPSGRRPPEPRLSPAHGSAQRRSSRAQLSQIGRAHV